MTTSTEFEVNDTLSLKTFRVVYGDKDCRLEAEVNAVNIFRAIDKIERRIGDAPGFRVLSVKEMRPKFIG